MDLVEISRKSRPKQTIASAALAAVHSINTPSSFQSFFSRDASRRRGKQPRSARVGSATAMRHGGPQKASDSRPTPVGGIHTKQRKVIVSESIVDSGRVLLTGSQRAWMRSLLLAAAAPIAQKNLIQDPLYFFFFFLPSFSSGFHEHSRRQWDGAANLGGTAKSETMANNASRAQFLAGLSPSLARQELHGRRSSCQQDLAPPPSSNRRNNGWSLNHLGDSPVGSASRRK